MTGGWILVAALVAAGFWLAGLFEDARFRRADADLERALAQLRLDKARADDIEGHAKHRRPPRLGLDHEEDH